MSGWVNNVPPFDWWDYDLTGFGRTLTLISEATLPLGCRAQVSAYSRGEGLVTYVSCIVTCNEKGRKEARSLGDAKKNARESWIEMLAEAIGDDGASKEDGDEDQED